MYIKEIKIQKFRHLEDVNLGPFSEPPKTSDIVTLAGPNGGGKSSILELIGYGLSQTYSLGWALSRSFPNFSFEVAIGLSSFERELVKEYVDESTVGQWSEEVVKYLDELGTYYRAFNYTEGKFQQNPTLYNKVHNLVISALKNHYQRSMGFFIKSDRQYPRENFNRKRLSRVLCK